MCFPCVEVGGTHQEVSAGDGFGVGGPKQPPQRSSRTEPGRGGGRRSPVTPLCPWLRSAEVGGRQGNTVTVTTEGRQETHSDCPCRALPFPAVLCAAARPLTPTRTALCPVLQWGLQDRTKERAHGHTPSRGQAGTPPRATQPTTQPSLLLDAAVSGEGLSPECPGGLPGGGDA